MVKKLKYGEFYYYIDNEGKVVKRMNTLQDVDILNGMRGNFYPSEARARFDRNNLVRRKEK